MARKRMIDPDIWKSEQVCGLTSAQFMLYIFLISQADDDGRLKVSIEVWRRAINLFHPWSAAKLTADLEVILTCLDEKGKPLVQAYCSDGDWYLAHPNWHEYQSINHPTPSKLPKPPEYRSSTGVLRDTSSQLIKQLVKGRHRRAAKSARGASPEETSPDNEHRCSAAGAQNGAAANVRGTIAALARAKEFK